MRLSNAFNNYVSKDISGSSATHSTASCPYLSCFRPRLMTQPRQARTLNTLCLDRFLPPHKHHATYT
jgi:hypothetical protein